MKRILSILVLFILVNCQSRKVHWLLIQNEDIPSKNPPFGYSSGYINTKGDTIVPLNKYGRCFTDTVRSYAVVYDEQEGLIGIDLKGNKLFNAVWSQEGDNIKEHEGMILIVENGKYGFANDKGKIVIEPQYKCAESFHNGKAKVSQNCSLANDEHEKWKMKTWFFINKKGKKIK